MLFGRKIPMQDGAVRAAFALCFFLFFALATPALADTDDIIAPSDPTHPAVDSGWQAGTCKDEPDPVDEPCSIATPDLFFDTAAAHPNFGFTQFIIKHGPPPGEAPVDELKTVRVDLPVGLSVNPGATPRCKLSVFEAGACGCPLESKVGESFVTAAGPAGADRPGGRRHPGPRLQRRTETGGGSPLRARTRRQRSLPRRRRRLDRQLPRGIHDPRPRRAAGRSRWSSSGC